MQNAKLAFRGDAEEYSKMVSNCIDQNSEYKKACSEYDEAISHIGHKESIAIDEAVMHREWATCEAIYTKAFHDGMRFILDAMAGKEVIKI